MSAAELRKFLERRKKHAEDRVELIRTKHGDNPSETHNYHGGWSLGYWEGKLTAVNDILDDIDELEE